MCHFITKYYYLNGLKRHGEKLHFPIPSIPSAQSGLQKINNGDVCQLNFRPGNSFFLLGWKTINYSTLNVETSIRY